MPTPDVQGDFGVFNMASKVLKEDADQKKDGKAVIISMITAIEMEEKCSNHDIVQDAERPVMQRCEDERNCQILIRNGGRKNNKNAGVEAKTFQNILSSQEKTGRNNGRFLGNNQFQQERRSSSRKPIIIEFKTSGEKLRQRHRIIDTGRILMEPITVIPILDLGQQLRARYIQPFGRQLDPVGKIRFEFFLRIAQHSGIPGIHSNVGQIVQLGKE